MGNVQIQIVLIEFKNNFKVFLKLILRKFFDGEKKIREIKLVEVIGF